MTAISKDQSQDQKLRSFDNVSLVKLYYGLSSDFIVRVFDLHKKKCLDLTEKN